jgi:hypothetical protein
MHNALLFCVQGPTVTWLGRREGKVSFTTKMKRQHLHAAAKRHTKKSLKLFVVEVCVSLAPAANG